MATNVVELDAAQLNQQTIDRLVSEYNERKEYRKAVDNAKKAGAEFRAAQKRYSTAEQSLGKVMREIRVIINNNNNWSNWMKLVAPTLVEGITPDEIRDLIRKYEAVMPLPEHIQKRLAEDGVKPTPMVVNILRAKVEEKANAKATPVHDEPSRAEVGHGGLEGVATLPVEELDSAYLEGITTVREEKSKKASNAVSQRQGRGKEKTRNELLVEVYEHISRLMVRFDRPAQLSFVTELCAICLGTGLGQAEPVSIEPKKSTSSSYKPFSVRENVQKKYVQSAKPKNDTKKQQRVV